MRKTIFVIEEKYHIYNRGVDKRNIFEDKEDLIRFLQSMKEFNSTESIGSIHGNSFKSLEIKSTKLKLVRFVAYCLNQNHYHFILEPLVENGVQKFMHKIATGYTNFFNEKYKRTGSLFQGKYKSIHIGTNDYLLHLSVYINFNNLVHENLNKSWLLQLPFSSLGEYAKQVKKDAFCDTSVILNQYSSRVEYMRTAQSVLFDIINRKKAQKELQDLIIE